jgi:hypothetical protein
MKSKGKLSSDGPEAHKMSYEKGGINKQVEMDEAKPSLEGKGSKIGMSPKSSVKNGASMEAHEARDIEKGKGGKGGSPFPGKPTSSGFATGPMKHGGVDSGKIKADGSIKGEAPAPGSHQGPKPKLEGY